jgi:hypothetical protein
MLQHLLSQLQEILTKADTTYKAVLRKMGELDGREASILTRENEWKKKDKDLIERESVITPAENLKAARRDIDDKVSRLSEERTKLEADRTSFNSYASARKAELDNREQGLKEIEKNLEIMKKNIDTEAQKKVDEFLKNFKK